MSDSFSEMSGANYQIIDDSQVCFRFRHVASFGNHGNSWRLCSKIETKSLTFHPPPVKMREVLAKCLSFSGTDSLICADVPLRNYSLTDEIFESIFWAGRNI